MGKTVSSPLKGKEERERWTFIPNLFPSSIPTSGKEREGEKKRRILSSASPLFGKERRKKMKGLSHHFPLTSNSSDR